MSKFLVRVEEPSLRGSSTLTENQLTAHGSPRMVGHQTSLSLIIISQPTLLNHFFYKWEYPFLHLLGFTFYLFCFFTTATWKIVKSWLSPEAVKKIRFSLRFILYSRAVWYFLLLKEIFWLRDGVLDSNSRNPCWHASLVIKIHGFLLLSDF